MSVHCSDDELACQAANTSRQGVTLPVPSIEPDHRDLADVANTSSYQRDDRVWVYEDGLWCAGIIEAASTRAAMVTYRPPGARGTGVNTFTARSVQARADFDPDMDRTDSTLTPR
jgi:hypothetical protein